MFTIHTPVHPVDARARRTVYNEYVTRHQDLQHISVGCHNDMIMLEEDGETKESCAILLATGTPEQHVVFPRHWHSNGERTICLDGNYGEYINAGENLDDLFEGEMTLEQFQRDYPGLVKVLDEKDGQIPVILGLGACWSMAPNTEHKPFGFVGEKGILLGQIYWGGPNEIRE